MAMRKRVLITGATGFVGKHLVPALEAACAGYELVCASRSLQTSGTARHVAADLTDDVVVEALMADLRPDFVVHLAAQSSIGEAMGDAERTWQANFLTTYHLGSALARHAPNATMLFSSSATVYGASFNDGIADENTPPHPLDAYSRSKLAAELALADIMPKTARLIIARPVNHSGWHHASRNFVLPSFAAQIVAIENGSAPPQLVVGDLSKARDFLDVRDVVAAYMELIAKAETFDARVNVFNVASSTPYTIKSLLDGLRAHARCSFKVKINPDLLRPSALDVPTMRCDASRIAEATGWRPLVPVDAMLCSLLDFWRTRAS